MKGAYKAELFPFFVPFFFFFIFKYGTSPIHHLQVEEFSEMQQEHFFPILITLRRKDLPRKDNMHNHHIN